MSRPFCNGLFGGCACARFKRIFAVRATHNAKKYLAIFVTIQVNLGNFINLVKIVKNQSNYSQLLLKNAQMLVT
jgi:hypothetical protein